MATEGCEAMVGRASEHAPEGPAAHRRTAVLEIGDLNSAIALMRMRGMRVSAARRLVLEALLAADGPMSAEQIAEGIGGRVPSSDLASVYRNLQAFEDIGLVRHLRALRRLPAGGAARAGRRAGADRAPVRLSRELHPLSDRRPVLQLHRGRGATARTVRERAVNPVAGAAAQPARRRPLNR